MGCPWNLNGIWEASPDELEPVRAARADFRGFWESMRPPFPCAFEGTLDDLHALDCLDYEGPGYPASGLEGAALVWGNVIQHLGPFRWLRSYRGDLLLGTSDDDECFLIWPFARVFEVHNASRPPRCAKYQWLAGQVLVECEIHGLAVEGGNPLRREMTRDPEGFIAHARTVLVNLAGQG
jgi:hypothetical protein